MDIGAFVKIIEDEFSKGRPGYVGTVINSALADANEMLFKAETGIDQLPEGAPGTYWQKSRIVTDALRPFIVTMGENGVNWLEVNSNGEAEFPPDFYLFSSMTCPIFENINGQVTITDYRNITDLPDEIYSSRISSANKRPSLDYIISTVTNGKLVFSPKNINRIRFTYLRKPKAPFYYAEFDEATGQVVYFPPGSLLPSGQPSPSVNIEWPEKSIIQDFKPHVLSFLGNSLVDKAMQNVSERIKTIGQ
jgi:hypothetical protein